MDGDLTVASVQDTGRIHGSSRGLSAGLSYGLGSGDWGDSGGETGAQDSESDDEGDDGPSALERMGLNGSLSHSDEKGRKAWVREQSGLVAGGDVDVSVGGHTQLGGSVVASTGGGVTLETETFGYSDTGSHRGIVDSGSNTIPRLHPPPPPPRELTLGPSPS